MAMAIPSMDHNIRKCRVYELEGWCRIEASYSNCSLCPEGNYCGEFELNIIDYADRFLGEMVWEYETRTERQVSQLVP